MRKAHPRLIATFSHLPVVLVIMILFVVSCRKADHFTPDKPEQQAGLSENRFFTAYASSHPAIQAAQHFLQEKDRQYHFTGTFMSRAGMPRWNKALVFSTAPATIRTKSDFGGEDATVAYIPFVRDSQNFVNATIVVRMTPRDTAYRVLCNWQYSEYGFQPSDTSWSARDIFAIFAILDKSVFGHTKHRINDGRIFDLPQGNRLIATESESPQSETFELQCTPHTVCITALPFLERTGPVAERVCNTSYTCVLVWTGGGENPGPLPGGGGGSEIGGGGPSIPSNPCELNCEEPWQPVEDPCATLQTLLDSSNVSGAMAAMQTYTNDSSEHGFLYKQDEQGHISLDSADEVHGDPWDHNIDLVITSGIDGFWHTHFQGGNSVFTPNDIHGFAQMYHDGMVRDLSLFTLGLITANATQYILKVDDEVQFLTFIENLLDPGGPDKPSGFYSYVSEYKYIVSSPFFSASIS